MWCLLELPFAALEGSNLSKSAADSAKNLFFFFN